MRIQKIINIMCHPPAYELFWNDPRPEINWNIPDGRWVGIWGKDWSELIGKEVLKLTDEFKYEVWQPDLRADKIYTHTFSNGLVRKLFPAESKTKFYGLKKIKYVISQPVCENLITESRRNGIILHLNGINSAISRNILNLSLNCPVAVVSFGEVKVPLNTLFKFKKNMLAKIDNIREHFILKKIYEKVDLVTYCNERTRETLGRYFKDEMILLYVGIDFNLWKRRSEKNHIRKSLGLKNSDFILLSSSRFNSLKQIDKMINVLKDLDHNNFDFQYIITGHGDREYERYINSIGETLIRKGKLKFVGFLPEEKLIDYYNAADLFIITSLSEGAPVSAIKAMAMEMPIFSTDTGLVAELLSKYNAGVVVPLKDYKMWKHKLREILNGKEIKTINREITKSFFHWPNVARQYITMYKKLYDNYYGGDE
jgi:glycosyltransferase involved in cell wall biosynthesis